MATKPVEQGAYANGFEDYGLKYIHRTWKSFKKQVGTVNGLGGITADSVNNLYLQYANEADAKFKSKFGVLPDEADNINKAFSAIYDINNAELQEIFLHAVNNINNDLKSARKGSRGDTGFIKKALSSKADKNAQAQLKRYIKSLNDLLNAVNQIDKSVMAHSMKDGAKAADTAGLTGKTLQVLKANQASITAYKNIQTALRSLERASAEIKYGLKNSVGIISYEKYSTSVDKMTNLCKSDWSTKSIDAHKFSAAIDGNISLLIGEYAEYAFIEALKIGMSDVMIKIESSGADMEEGKKIKEDLKGTALNANGEEITINMSVKSVNHAPSQKVTYNQGSVKTILENLGMITDTAVYEYLIMNAITQKTVSNKNAFNKSGDEQVFRMLEYMAALSADFAIGKDIDYMLYANAAVVKGDVLRSMGDMNSQYKKLHYTLPKKADINVDMYGENYFKYDMMHRITDTRNAIYNLSMLIESK